MYGDQKHAIDELEEYVNSNMQSNDDQTKPNKV